MEKKKSLLAQSIGIGVLVFVVSLVIHLVFDWEFGVLRSIILGVGAVGMRYVIK